MASTKEIYERQRIQQKKRADAYQKKVGFLRYHLGRTSRETKNILAVINKNYLGKSHGYSPSMTELYDGSKDQEKRDGSETWKDFERKNAETEKQIDREKQPAQEEELEPEEEEKPDLYDQAKELKDKFDAYKDIYDRAKGLGKDGTGKAGDTLARKGGEKLAKEGGKRAVKEGGKAVAGQVAKEGAKQAVKAGGKAVAEQAAAGLIAPGVGNAILLAMQAKDLKDTAKKLKKAQTGEKESFLDKYKWPLAVVMVTVTIFGFTALIAISAISLSGYFGRITAKYAKYAVDTYNNLKQLAMFAHINFESVQAEDIITKNKNEVIKILDGVIKQAKIDPLMTTEQRSKVDSLAKDAKEKNFAQAKTCYELWKILQEEQVSRTKKDRKKIEELKQKINSQKKELDDKLKEVYQEIYKCEMYPVGTTNATGKVELPKSNYYSYDGKVGLDWGKPRTICAIMKLSEEWAKIHTNEKLILGDISSAQKNTTEHQLHQNGEETTVKGNKINPDNNDYDREEAKKFINLMLQLKIAPIFTSDKELVKEFKDKIINGKPKVRHSDNSSKYYNIHIEL